MASVSCTVTSRTSAPAEFEFESYSLEGLGRHRLVESRIVGGSFFVVWVQVACMTRVLDLWRRAAHRLRALRGLRGLRGFARLARLANTRDPGDSSWCRLGMGYIPVASANRALQGPDILGSSN